MEDLLLLVHRIPYPPNKGDKVRSYHLLRHLATHYRVHLGTFVDDAQDWQHADKVRGWCGETHFAKLDPRLARIRSLRGLVNGKPLALPYYFDAGLAEWVDGVLRRFPVRRVVVFSSPMAQYVNHRKELRRVVDFVDLDSAKWAQYAAQRSSDGRFEVGGLLQRWLYRREARRLLEFERETAAASVASVFVTEAEAALFRRLAPESAQKTVAVQNGVDTDFFSPLGALPSPYDTPARVLVFTGAMDYRPNVDAVDWFVRGILPKIKEIRPDVRFYIVGARPTAEVQALGRDPAVTVTGTVADVRPYLMHAAVAVVPMRVARGIQNKALEAMAMARPVVITPASAAALNAEAGTDFCIAEDADQFAQRVAALLHDHEAAERMGAAARACVLRNYSWTRNLGMLDRCFDAVPAADIEYAESLSASGRKAPAGSAALRMSELSRTYPVAR